MKTATVFVVSDDPPSGDPRQASASASVTAAPGETLLSVLRRAGVALDAPCGGCGLCGKCAVEVRRGKGWQRVLACQTLVEDAIQVRPPARAGALRVDDDAVLEGGLPARFALDVAEAADLGVAVDLGTTTVAAYLFDCASGTLLARDGVANPQATFGADVISRIHACSGGRLGALQHAAAGCVQKLAQRLCIQAGVDPAYIRRWAVAGNTVMEHILCGVSPESIGSFPFQPATLFGDFRTVEGFSAPVFLCPCVSGYVGGDIVAGLVATGIDELLEAEAPHKTVLFADLGTNGEMALVANGELLCCATATGPAFEGAAISQGMQARDGAISACKFADGGFNVTTIGDAAPAGICGSGLIDALAACLEAGVVDETGRLLSPDELPAHLRRLVGLRDGKPVALLVPSGAVVLTQKDIRALQLAKAAVSAGVSSLLREAGLAPSDIDEFVIGGAFGAHMSPSSAAAIGMFPDELLPRVRMVGNCAGAGSCLALLSAAARDRMQVVVNAARYIELSLDTAFSEDYIDAMEF